MPKTSIDALAYLGHFFAGSPGLLLEWSLRAQAGEIANGDRFTVWLESKSGESATFEPISNALVGLGAPESVLSAQQHAASVSVRQGISISPQANGLEWRLYLHTYPPGDLRATYRSYRWVDSGTVETDEYSFHYLPSLPDGRTPDDLVHPACAKTVRTLLAHPRLQSSSGFWLRQRDGDIRQVDLAYPWHPPLSEMADILAGFCNELGAPIHWLSRYAEYPLRHIAFTGAHAEPSVTVYFSAPIPSNEWPASLPDLQIQVNIYARQVNQALEQNLFSRLPPRPVEQNQAIGAFYDTKDIERWRYVLGHDLHYHFGLFDPNVPVAQQAESAFTKAVSRLYSYIPRGANVYDLGCGWGGPARQLIRDWGCRVEGITASRSQYEYCANLGLLVRHGDMETTLPPGQFDVLLMLESLSHVRDKLRLLKTLRLFGKQLIMREHCQNASPASVNFGGTMYLNSSLELRHMLFEAGWKITRWRNRRIESLPSVQIWHERLQTIQPTDDLHLETLREFCARVLAAPADWAASNPLMEVTAD